MRNGQKITRRLGGKDVVLREKAPHVFVGLCPFHAEKKPQLVVFLQQQRFECMSCGAKGPMA